MDITVKIHSRASHHLLIDFDHTNDRVILSYLPRRYTE